MANPESENREKPGRQPNPGPATRPHLDETALLGYGDGSLPAAESGAVEAHLAICPDCRALARQWRQLEANLERGLPRPALSADFAARLWRRIETESTFVSQSDRAQLKRKQEAEFETGWAECRRHLLRAQLPWLLDYLGYGVGAALGGYGLYRLLAWYVAASTHTGTLTLSASALSMGMAGSTTLLLVAGFAFAARRQVGRLLARL